MKTSCVILLAKMGGYIYCSQEKLIILTKTFELYQVFIQTFFVVKYSAIPIIHITYKKNRNNLVRRYHHIFV